MPYVLSIHASLPTIIFGGPSYGDIIKVSLVSSIPGPGSVLTDSVLTIHRQPAHNSQAACSQAACSQFLACVNFWQQMILWQQATPKQNRCDMVLVTHVLKCLVGAELYQLFIPTPVKIITGCGWLGIAYPRTFGCGLLNLQVPYESLPRPTDPIQSHF